MTMYTAIIILFLFSSVIAIILDMRKSPLFTWVKPLPLCILISALVITGLQQELSAGWLIVAGLVLGMGGDVLLTRDRLFLAGLASFLAGHIFYIVFFTVKSSTFSPILLFFILAPVLYAVIFYARLPREKSSMRLPVGVYMTVITIMVITAANLHLNTPGGQELFAAGALFFFLSDSILAWHMMIASVRYDSLLVMSTYYTGQFCIASGILLPLL
ncbi:MAG: lysoplasmalogenase [Spirochaetota bacterium]